MNFKSKGILPKESLHWILRSYLQKEWFRIARTIKDMGNRSGTGEAVLLADVAPLWRFLDFIAMHRSPLYTLLIPFIHAR